MPAWTLRTLGKAAPPSWRSASRGSRGSELSPHVVPAKAGTHNHRIELVEFAGATAFAKPLPGVMGPGLRRDDGGLQSRQHGLRDISRAVAAAELRRLNSICIGLVHRKLET